MEILILVLLFCGILNVVARGLLFEFSWKQKSSLQRLHAFLRLRSLEPYRLYRSVTYRTRDFGGHHIQFFYFTETEFIVFAGPDRHDKKSSFYKTYNDDSTRKSFACFEISLKEQTFLKKQNTNQLSNRRHDLISVKDYVKKTIPELFLLEEEKTPISYITSSVPAFRSFIKGFITRKKMRDGHPKKES